jgi:TolB-like protein/Flp pilus assembly protein TadD
MSRPSEVAYTFGSFRLVPAEKQLVRGGEVVPLAPKAFDTLLLLVENQGRLVEKDVFMRRVWPDSFVEEVALAHGISQLRKALREGSEESNFIETVPKRGYRFIAPVKVTAGEAAQSPPGVTLAVLPFENLSADPEREYLADGLTEEVIAALGQVHPEQLRVIGRTSMMAYKRTTKSLAEIGGELGAGFLLESSIRAEGGRLRITSKLVRVRDQVQIWSATYDSEPGSILEFQRELSTAITQQIRSRLSPERLNAIARRYTRDVEAHDLYLRGRYFWNQLSSATTRRAIEFYSRAVELDPDYALVWSGLTDAYATGPITGDAPPLRMGPLAREAVGRALAAEPNLPEVQCSLGFVKFWLDWDWTSAERAFRAAISLDPSYALAYRTLGITLSHMGRSAEAARAAQQARELDPLHAGHYALSAQVAYNGHDFGSAIRLAREATVLDPEFWVGHLQLAQAYEQSGDDDLALEALQQAWGFSSGNSKVLSLRGYILAKLGRMHEAGEVLHSLEAVPRERYVPPYAVALVNAGLGRHDLAVDWLERAYEARDVHLVFLPVEPKWDCLRADPRFQAIVGRCSFHTQAPFARIVTSKC